MTKRSRRDVLRGLGALSLAGAAHLALPGGRTALAQGSARAEPAPVSAGRLFVSRRGPVAVHSYVAPEASVLVTSHLIESANALVMVDAQLARGPAQELAAYAASLGKPLERIVVSHEHPDHWAANEAFDAPLATLPEVATRIAASYDATVATLQGALGEQGPVAPRLPEGLVTDESETIDGVRYEYRTVRDAEAPVQLVVLLPEAGTAVVQDLLYNNAHAFPLGDVGGWLAALEPLRALTGEGYDTLLPGHGLPTTAGEIDVLADYLESLEATLAESGSAAEARAALMQRWPGFGALGLLDFLAGRFAQE